MATGTFEYRTESERKCIERAIAFAAEMHALALTSPAGHVPDQCEQQATDRGRDLLRDLLQGAVRTRIEAGFPADRAIGVLGWLSLRARKIAW